MTGLIASFAKAPRIVIKIIETEIENKISDAKLLLRASN
jgi:hypothetical protein